MNLEFTDNPNIVVRNRPAKFVAELKKHPLRWAIFKTSPKKDAYWAKRFSVDLSSLKKKFPEVDWHRASTDDAHQIVAWYQPKESDNA